VRAFLDTGVGGSSDADVRTFLCKKLEFFKIYVVPARTKGEGIEPVRTFCRQRGSIFLDFVPTSFMDGPFLLVSNQLLSNF